jgi:hypothetical protein
VQPKDLSEDLDDSVAQSTRSKRHFHAHESHKNPALEESTEHSSHSKNTAFRGTEELPIDPTPQTSVQSQDSHSALNKVPNQVLSHPLLVHAQTYGEVNPTKDLGRFAINNSYNWDEADLEVFCLFQSQVQRTRARTAAFILTYEALGSQQTGFEALDMELLVKRVLPGL